MKTTNPELDDNGSPHFRGTWTPAYVHQMVWDGVLDLVDSALLTLIDAFVNNSGEDCYASNEYLAKRVNLSPRTVAASIKKMIDLGLVIRTKFDGRKRHIRTVFSRMERGEVSENSVAALQNTEDQLCKKRRSRHVEICTVKEYKNKGTKNNKLSEVAPRTDSEGGKVKEKYPSHPAKEERPTDNRFHRFARKLAEAIQKIKNIKHPTQQLNTWAKSFELLHRINGVEVARIKSATAWYCEQLPLRYRDKYFLAIESGAAFREKFTKLEAAIQRDQQTDEDSDKYDREREDAQFNVVVEVRKPSKQRNRKIDLEDMD